MAVNMNKRECLQKIFIFSLGILAFCLLVPAGAQTTTQPAVTTSDPGLNVTTATVNATTTIATTTTPTTTTTTIPTTTTTTIAPLQAPTEIDSNSLIGQCPCDLTGNACDVNCCCDVDCSTDDNATFSECLPYAKDVDPKLCFREEIILFDNSNPTVKSITDQGLFCIFFDNKAERNFYTNPDLITSQFTFDEYRQEFPTFSFQSPPVTTVNLSAEYYRSGDPVYTVSPSQAIGMLGLPRSLTSAQCLDGNSAAYLLDESFTCARTLPVSQCLNTSAVNSQSYVTGFKVVKSPKMFQEHNTSIESGGVYDLYNNSYTIDIEVPADMIECYTSGGLTAACGFSTPPAPTLDGTGTVCQNVVKEVHYTVYTAAGTAGIDIVRARLVLQNVTSQAFTQTFSVDYQQSAAGNAFQRSGNPGYAVGQPVLAGTLNQTTQPDGTVIDRIIMATNRNRYMTIPKPSFSGYCDVNTDRASVVFGQEFRSGCMLSVSADNLTQYCSLMQQKIINTMEFDSVPEIVSSGFRDNNRYVGLYGNSDVSKTGDWVKILYPNRLKPSAPQAGQSGCTLSLGMHIQIVYANIGALVNPQAKIIGVSFIYDSQLVQIRPTLDGRYNQPIEVVSSVQFIDVSKPAVGFQGEPPVFLAKVPYDFFYPFISGGSTQLSVSRFFPLLTVLVVLLCWL